MKLARHTPLPPASAPSKLGRAASDTTDVADVSATDCQLALAPHTRKSTSTRTLCRKTCSKVESWLEKLFVSDTKTSAALSSDGATKKRKQLARRASTGSLLGRSVTDGRTSTPSRLERAGSLFSLHSADKENVRSNASEPSATKTARRKKRDDTKDWLTPVASFPEPLERDEPMPLSPTTIKSVVHAAVAPAPPLAQEPQLFTYVTPPIEMPSTYRIQDRHGGMIVAGRAVLFTNAAFKRRLRDLRQLRAIPEHEPAALLDARLDVYLYGLQHFGTSCSSAGMYDAEPLSQWI